MKFKSMLISCLAPVVVFSCVRHSGSGGNKAIGASIQYPKITSSQRGLDTVNTKVALRNCAATTPSHTLSDIVADDQAIGTADVQGVQFPTPPEGQGYSCDIFLTQLTYNTGSVTYTFIPSDTNTTLKTKMTMAADGNVSLESKNNDVSYKVFSIKKSDGSDVYTSQPTLTASVSGSTDTSTATLSLSWSVSANDATSTAMQNFTATGSDALPPTVTTGSIFYNTSTKKAAFTLNFINDTGVPDTSATIPHNANSIYAAKVVGDAAAGTRCALFYSSSTPSPTWLTSGTGSVLPTKYSEAESLFTAAYGKAEPNKGYFDCSSLLTYTTSNWGGSSLADKSTTTVNFAKYNWFAIFANALDKDEILTSKNAYTILKIPAVAAAAK